MATLGAVKARVLDQLDRDDLTAQVALAIEDSIRHYATRRWHFNQKRVYKVLNPGSYRVAIPDDLIELDALTVTVDDRPYDLREITWQELKERHINSDDTGSPDEFCTYEEQFWFDAYTDETYTFTLSYLYDLGAPSGDSDSNDWTTDGENLIRNRACAHVAATILHDMDLASAFKRLEQESEVSLARRAELLTTRGRTRVHRW